MATRPETEPAESNARTEAIKPVEPDSIAVTLPADLHLHATEPCSDQAAHHVIDLPPRFDVKRVIGRGGMGIVVEAVDRNLGRPVAVKVLAADKRDAVHRVRFRREAKATAVLRHPNIVTVHDVDPDRDFIVMELVHGESLEARLQREGVLPIAEVRRIGRALLDALAAAHDAGIVHRDIKPANILIDDAGVVKLVDFGVASFGDRDLTSSGARIGTPAYMAPEQLRGRVTDVRVDIYAVGATLFEAATGTRMHADDRSERNIVTAVIEATGDPALAIVIERAVAELPEDRFSDARTFADGLRVEPKPATNKNHLWWFATAGVVVAAAMLTVVVRGRHTVVEPEVDAAIGSRRIAMLPFIDHTRDPQLDFARSGLPDILTSELRKISGLDVVGYYDIQDRLPDPAAPVADWLATARSLGAVMIVRGELRAEPAGVRVVVEIASIGGEVLGRFDRTAGVHDVTNTTRAAVVDVARVVLGKPAAPAGARRPFDTERDLANAIDALDRQDFDVADKLLQKLELQADVTEAHYYRAVLNWWSSRNVNAPAKRALAGNLDAAQRGFMEGLVLLQDGQHTTEAIERFRVIAERFPDHRDIQYGLFEALYHGGRPAEAMAVYRRLGTRAPRFRLGLKHALAYYIGHADEGGIAWALARLDPKLPDSVLWHARASVARRDYATAIEVLRRSETANADAKRAVHHELATVYLLDGQFALAADVSAGWSTADVSHNAAALLGLAQARGLADESQWSEKAAHAADLATGVDELEHGWIELSAIELPVKHSERLRRLAVNLPPTVLSINKELARVLIAGALGDGVEIERARASVVPEVVAIAEAYRAESTNDHARAATWWARAAEHAADGVFAIVEWFAAARAARAAGDHATTLEHCDAVIRPRRFTWAWGGAVGPCLRWSAEAARALGRDAEARALWERLLALRSSAAPGDELVRAARAGLR